MNFLEIGSWINRKLLKYNEGRVKIGYTFRILNEFLVLFIVSDQQLILLVKDISSFVIKHDPSGLNIYKSERYIILD